jgi:hypothetical protein
MALFTDGPVSSIEELTGCDSQLLSVATVEGIDVTKKLLLAQEELGIELETLLERRLVEKVVVTPSLRLWHAYRSLEMVYQDAYSSQLNDRYGNKRDEFRDLARWAMDRLIRLGVGLAEQPVPRAAPPQVMPTPGLVPDGTYYVTMSWVNAAGAEGACAELVSVITASSTFVVSPRRAPAVAVGWNVYAGTDPEHTIEQNTVPNPLGATWVQPEQLVTEGKRPGTGQAPDRLCRVARRISRG